MKQLPILYTFIRCPWAMRARLALAFMNIAYEACEVDLKNKPAALLEVSPKGTVPVLVLPEGTVIDQSLDIMYWAMPQIDLQYKDEIEQIISINDSQFKDNINHYKYPTRYPEDKNSIEHYRFECEKILQPIEQRLSKHNFLINDKETIADLAVFPLIRQFSMVDSKWFAAAPYPNLRRWLEIISNSNYFAITMKKL